MLVDFPFASDSDYINAVGFLLVALLSPLFTSTGRPIGLLDGNQPGVGKTLFANIIGMILDGSTPAVTEFTSSNEELSKKILASIRSNDQSIVLIDNARSNVGAAINSTTLESMAVAETISLRILGSSTNHEQPNDFVWILSMNGMKTTPDLAERGILIRLAYEGATSCREYVHNDLLAFVQEHRAEIIAALFGMIEHWKEQGRPSGRASHRFTYMACTIGGILDSCGIADPCEGLGFLSNHQESIQSINVTGEDLQALFGAAFQHCKPNQITTSFSVPPNPYISSEWIPFVDSSKIVTEELAAAKNNQAKATKVGLIFSRFLKTPFDVEIEGSSGRAEFVKVSLPHNRTGYQFRVTLDSTPEESTSIETDLDSIL